MRSAVPVCSTDAVGPKWIDGNHNEAQLLYSCYREALRSASKNGCHSIALPLISSGIYGYPKEQACRKAIQSCRDYIDSNPEEDIDIVFAVIDDQMYSMGKQTLSEIAPQYKKELDLQGIHLFAVKYYKLYMDPNTTYVQVEDGTFGDEAFDLGFKMDGGNSFSDVYDSHALFEYRELEKIIDKVDDIRFLGTAIFSAWRH